MASEQLATERQRTEDLHASLNLSEDRREDLAGQLETTVETIRRMDDEREQKMETIELRHYCALDTVREKWEAREQRALDELDRLLVDRERWGGADETALSRQLEGAREEQCLLREKPGR